jgi:hypothetical protein
MAVIDGKGVSEGPRVWVGINVKVGLRVRDGIGVKLAVTVNVDVSVFGASAGAPMRPGRKLQLTSDRKITNPAKHNFKTFMVHSPYSLLHALFADRLNDIPLRLSYSTIRKGDGKFLEIAGV